MLFLISFGVVLILDNPQVFSEDVVPISSFPYFPVSIQNENGEHRCIGNIIHRKYVLTTCRCTTVENGTELRPLDQNDPREKIVLLHQKHVTSKYKAFNTHTVDAIYVHPRCQVHDVFYLNDEAVILSSEFDDLQDSDLLEFFPVKAGDGKNIMFLAWRTSQVLAYNFLQASTIIVANRTSREACVKYACEQRPQWEDCRTLLPALSCLITKDDVCNLNFEGSAVFNKFGDLYYAEGLMPYALYSDRSCHKGYYGTILFTPLVDNDSFIYDVVTGRYQTLIQANSVTDGVGRVETTFTTAIVSCVFKMFF